MSMQCSLFGSLLLALFSQCLRTSFGEKEKHASKNITSLQPTSCISYFTIKIRRVLDDMSTKLLTAAELTFDS